MQLAGQRRRVSCSLIVPPDVLLYSGGDSTVRIRFDDGLRQLARVFLDHAVLVESPGNQIHPALG